MASKPWRIAASIEEWFEVINVIVWFYTSGIGAIVFAIFDSILIYYVFFYTRYWPFILIYCCWFYYDRNTSVRGGYRIRLFRYLPMFKYLANYFSMKIVKTADLSPDKNYIFACHPHGVIAPSCSGNFLNAFSDGKKLFPGLKFHFATIDLFRYIPLFREYILGIGAVSARKESLEYLLGEGKKGRYIVLFVGGAAEAAYAAPGKYNIILKKRKGFVKTALRTGSSLVPVIGFGDNDLFEPQLPTPGTFKYKMVNWIKRHFGFYFYISKSFVPRKVPITSVVGKPIHVPKITHPTSEEIDQYHAMYTNELIKLFNEHKSKYVENPDNTELIIIE